jgi:hypothetical protein
MSVVGQFKIKDSFKITGRGLVAIGDLTKGRVKVDMALDIFKNINNSDISKDMRKNVQQGLDINRDQLYDHPEPFGKLDNYFSKLPIDENTFIEYSKRLKHTTISLKDLIMNMD